MVFREIDKAVAGIDDSFGTSCLCTKGVYVTLEVSAATSSLDVSDTSLSPGTVAGAHAANRSEISTNKVIALKIFFIILSKHLSFDILSV